MSGKRLEMLEQLIGKGSTDPFVHYAHALELRSAGRVSDSLSALRQVGERFPDYVPTFLIAAQVALELGDDASARELGERGCEVAKRAGDEHALGELKAFLGAL